MRKYQRTAVVVAMLGSVSFLGAGVGQAADEDAQFKVDNKQNQSCEANDSKTAGLISIDDLNLAINILGLQTNDQSERKSVTCTQNFALGGR
ncbi:hypothetical protein ACIP39_16990 [Streptomyces tibetensis]|uniref:hypothetical protein n=1 Tax=Streptomyces tibetensis TaxID=2382123 RepID=UPI0037F88644